MRLPPHNPLKESILCILMWVPRPCKCHISNLVNHKNQEKETPTEYENKGGKKIQLAYFDHRMSQDIGETYKITDLRCHTCGAKDYFTNMLANQDLIAVTTVEKTTGFVVRMDELMDSL